MANGAHKVTKMFEDELSRFTGAPYVVCVDNASNALFLALYYERMMGKCDETIYIPKHTYPSVPCEIIHAGMKVRFYESPTHVTGGYNLEGTRVCDFALRFSGGMFSFDTIQILSFTGPHKHLKLGKGGAILTDDKDAYEWYKRARFSGRREMSYHDDNLDMLGWNFYMMPEVAAKGLLLMPAFFDDDGIPKTMPDKSLPYPDLSKFKVYQQ